MPETVEIDAAEPATEDLAEEPEAAQPERRLPAVLRPAVLAIAVAVMLVAGGAALAWLRIDAMQARADAQTEARDAAARFALDLGTYDYRTMDANFRLVRESSTANFAGQLKQITDAMTPLLTQTQATSQGSVPVAGVVEADETRAVVILFLDQTIKNTNTAQPRTDRSRMQLTVLKQDGVWKLDQVEAR
jgi:Mce-associated membrane protein